MTLELVFRPAPYTHPSRTLIFLHALLGPHAGQAHGQLGVLPSLRLGSSCAGGCHTAELFGQTDLGHLSGHRDFTAGWCERIPYVSADERKGKERAGKGCIAIYGQEGSSVEGIKVPAT
eukprot:scaffold81493_cov15-Tisochrysis_lutea.AAC.3